VAAVAEKLFELKVDYWTREGKKSKDKEKQASIKATYRHLSVTRTRGGCVCRHTHVGG
jgi:hypothetical protein